MTLVQWFSKKKSFAETSVFCAEFATMKHGIDALRGFIYMLRMTGILIFSPSYIYGDNMQVVHNASRPESVLRKRSISIFIMQLLEKRNPGLVGIWNPELIPNKDFQVPTISMLNQQKEETESPKTNKVNNDTS